MLEALSKLLSAIQNYASAYFQTVFRVQITFWLMPEVPSGANILTGAFAFLLIVAARLERSLSYQMADLSFVFPLLLVFVLFMSGLFLLADPDVPNQMKNWRRLVSAVSVSITLACGLIAFAWIVEWTRPLDYFSAQVMGWSDVGGNRLVAATAGVLITGLLFTNTARMAGGFVAALRKPRIMWWTPIFYLMVAVGISLVLLTKEG